MATNQNGREAWLEKVLGCIPAGSRILDAGAGELKYKDLCIHLKYVSQDFAKYDGKGDGAALQTGTWDQSRLDIVSDITAIPEPDGSFDAIMCIEVFEHLPDPLSAIREFARLLKPGGTLIVTAPFCSLIHFAPYHYSSGYSRYYYEHHLSAAGFVVEEITTNGNFFTYLSQELMRLREVAEKYSDGNKTAGLKEKLRGYALRILIDWLNNASESDRGSSELLCFGYHVLAKKK